VADERRCNYVCATTGGLRPPLLFRARSPADGIATFAIHKCRRTRSGGCQPAVSREPLMPGQFRADSHTAVARSVRSGEHQPAVVRETHLQERFRKVAGDCRRCADERRCNYVCETTGGLRPPLLAVHTFAHRKSRFFTVVRTMCTRSSGCEPAVVRESRLGGQSAHIRSRSSHAAPRAAGVSPPWLGKRTCNADTAHVRGHSSRAKAGAAGVSPP